MTHRCIIVTGVSKGLGEAIAANLLARGADVVGIGRTHADRLAGAAFRFVQADLREVESLPRTIDPLFDGIAARGYASVALVNNAAVAGPAGRFGAIDPRELRESVDVNLVAPAILANAFVRAFANRNGDHRIVNVSSGAAVHPIPGAGVYNLGKAGLEMIASVIASEQPKHGVQAITIRPGIIDTPMQAFIRSQPVDRLPSRAMFEAFHRDGQLVAPDVTAAAIVERLVLGPIEGGRVYSYDELR